MIDFAKLGFYLMLWALFGIVHSITATETLKGLIPLPKKLYRIIYNLINAALFIWITSFTPSISNIIADGFFLSGLRYYSYIIIVSIGIILFLVGVLHWDLLGFIGLKAEDRPLNTGGIYKFSRHPVYAGMIIVFLATLIIRIDEATLSWLIGVGGYFLIGTIPEENKLKTYFEEYEQYSKNVGRLIPFKSNHLNYLLNRN